MSTVLTNGIIIPDNGSRNWGGDLANNWNIIDVHVGYMTDVKNKVTTLENSVTTLETSVAENTANIQNNASNISALQTSKQDVIEDLETIRSGASTGATAVQPSELSDYATKSDLSSKANDSDVVHKSGDEIIQGVKNFYNVVLGEQDGVIRIGNNVEGAFFCTLGYDGQIYNNSKQFVPKTNNEYDLGSSSNKWKTLNGINPGALSLPNCAESVEVTSQVVNTNGVFQFTNNLYDGWLVITAFADNCRITNQGFECRANKSIDDAVTTHIALRLNETVYMNFTNFTNFAYVKLYKCLGNV